MYSFGRKTIKLADPDYFGHCHSEIQLENNIITKPLVSIKGKFTLKTKEKIRCQGIRVQLEATVNLKFETKPDSKGLTKIDTRSEGLLQGSAAPIEDDYNLFIRSPVREKLRRTRNDGKDPRNMFSKECKPGSYTYPFVLKMPEEPLPSPFHNEYGDLTYKIVVYFKNMSGFYVEMCQKPLVFKGYNNLIKQLNFMLRPITVESNFHKSSFTSMMFFKIILTVDKRGVLPGEEIPFTVLFINSKSCEVESIVVNLIRKLTYKGSLESQSTISNLDTFENNQVSNDDEITWKGKLTVPIDCIPSYNVKNKTVYSVIHLVQYDVTMAMTDYSGSMKGQVEVVIGTTRDPLEGTIRNLLVGSEQRRMSNSHIEDSLLRSQRERSTSITSDSSVLTTVSLPPAYSQLSSRAMSMDTLPPHYDDLNN